MFAFELAIHNNINNIRNYEYFHIMKGVDYIIVDCIGLELKICSDSFTTCSVIFPINSFLRACTPLKKKQNNIYINCMFSLKTL